MNWTFEFYCSRVTFQPHALLCYFLSTEKLCLIGCESEPEKLILQFYRHAPCEQILTDESFTLLYPVEDTGWH